MVSLDEPTGDDADHPRVPSSTAEDDRPQLGRSSSVFDHRAGLGDDPLLDPLAIGIALVELIGDDPGNALIVRGEKLDRPHRAFKPAGGVDPRREIETDRSAGETFLVEAARDLHQRAKSDRWPGLNAGEAMTNEDPVLVLEGDKVGDCRKRDESHRVDEKIAEVGRRLFAVSEALAHLPGEFERHGGAAESAERILAAGEPGMNESEWMDQIYFGYDATTDRMGRFVFDRVIPGTASVGRSIRVSPNSWATYSREVIEVEPGETAKVWIGGEGRPVIGRFVKPDQFELAIDWSHSRHWLQLKRPPYRQPQGATEEERAESYRKWLETDEGKAYQAWQKDRRNHAFRIEDDGSFRIDDVTSGTYDLSLTILDGGPNNGKPLVTAKRTVVVPEMEGGQSVEPLALGTIELVPPP